MVTAGGGFSPEAKVGTPMKFRHILRGFVTWTVIIKDWRPGAVTNMIGTSLSLEKAQSEASQSYCASNFQFEG